MSSADLAIVSLVVTTMWVLLAVLTVGVELTPHAHQLALDANYEPGGLMRTYKPGHLHDKA